jgi:hypothetical protein
VRRGRIGLAGALTMAVCGGGKKAQVRRVTSGPCILAVVGVVEGWVQDEGQAAEQIQPLVAGACDTGAAMCGRRVMAVRP